MSRSNSDDFTRPAETMRERVGESRVRLWVLITTNRWLVAGIITAASYLLLVLLVTVGPGSIQKFLTTDAAGGVFTSIIIATVTSVTLVLTISQLVLSNEIGPLGEQRQRMQNTTDFREDLEEVGGIGTSPAEPSRFLQMLIALVETRANRLNEAVTEDSTPDELDDIVAYTDGIIGHSQTVRGDLERAEFGSFQLLLPVLNYNYSWKIAAARNLRDEYAASLSETADDAFAELIDALRFFGPAREHFKSLYFQWEVINVSRAMLYGAMPTLMIAAYMVFVFDPTTIPGSVFGVNVALLFTSAAYALSLVPFAVLLAYLLRLLTVAQRTLAIGPFILRDNEALESVRFPDEPE